MLLFPLHSVSGLGSAEQIKPEPQAEKQNAVIYVCDIDVSQLPSEQKIAGRRLRNEFLHILGQIQRRKRSSEEILLYRDSLWEELKARAAKSLTEARNSRDTLFFKGYSENTYKKELIKIEASIRDLEKNYTAVQNNPPNIAERVQLSLHKDMADGNFKNAPAAEERKKFCTEQGIDFLLVSSLRELYSRWILTYSLYRAVDDTVIYTDTFAFSPEELGSILSLLASSLYETLSGEPAGAIQIIAKPENSEIAINEKIMGKGNTSVIEGPPEVLSVQITHPAYFPAEFTIARRSNELSIGSIALTPMAQHALRLEMQNKENLSLYVNGLYRGNTPLDISLPAGNYVLQIVKNEGETEIQSKPFVLESKDGLVSLSENDVQSRGKQTVEQARKGFYGAFGRFWLALPAAFLLSGITDTYINAYNLSGNRDLINPATTFYYSSQGAWVVTGIFLIESLFRLGFYVYSASNGASTVIEPKQ
ncbi:MAG: PEGA domain-containing protein [Treponema sp.]|nr:PEGA domain-containing protein [Treponema sp.]